MTFENPKVGRYLIRKFQFRTNGESSAVCDLTPYNNMLRIEPARKQGANLRRELEGRAEFARQQLKIIDELLSVNEGVPKVNDALSEAKRAIDVLMRSLEEFNFD